MPEKNIIRVAHDREHPYVMVARATIDDKRLSYDALGLLVYLLSKPDHWQTRIDPLKRDSAGRDKIRRLLKELVAAGYVVVDHTTTKSGKFDVNVYTVYETPVPFTENPSTVQPSTVQPSTGNPPLVITDPVPNTEPNQTLRTDSPGADAPDAAPPAEKAKRAPNKNQPIHDALITAFGLDAKNMTRVSDGIYWKIAAELAAIQFDVADVGGLYEYVAALAKQGEWHSFSVVSLSKYAPAYLATKKPTGGKAAASPTAFKDLTPEEQRQRREQLERELGLKGQS